MNKVVSVYLVSVLAGISTLCGGLNEAYAADKDQNSENVEMLSAERNKVNAATSLTTVAEADNAASKSLQLLLGNMKQFRARFDQTVVDKLRWETTFPDETLLVADGEAVWNVDTFVEQVTVLSQANAIKDNPIVLLTSTDETTWSKFSISQMNGGMSTSETALQSYQITPNEEGGQIATLTLTFNQDNELTSLNMLDAQQQVSTLVFNNIETRFPVPADTFSVDIPDSFIIDDQR